MLRRSIVVAGLSAVAAGAALLTGAATGGAAGSARTDPAAISWADAKHRYGWVSTASPKRAYCSRDGNVICATDDGGKHWRAVFRGDTNMFGFLRWSKDAGVVSTGGYQHWEYWTRDGGRHWWGTGAFARGAVADSLTGYGAGPRFFVGRDAKGRRQLRYVYGSRWQYRARGWVPTRRLVCAGSWGRLGAEGEQSGPRNVCTAGPVGGDRINALPVGPAVRLSVVVTPQGSGGVRSFPSGIECGTFRPYGLPVYSRSACAEIFPQGSTVLLRPSVPAGGTLDWSGCPRLIPDPRSSSAPPWCSVTLAADTVVMATFG